MKLGSVPKKILALKARKLISHDAVAFLASVAKVRRVDTDVQLYLWRMSSWMSSQMSYLVYHQSGKSTLALNLNQGRHLSLKLFIGWPPRN